MKFIAIEKQEAKWCKPYYLLPSLYLKPEVRYIPDRKEYLTLVIGFLNYRLICSSFIRKGYLEKAGRYGHLPAPEKKRHWFPF